MTTGKGIKEAEDVLDLGRDLAQAIVDAKADGTVSVWDAPKFLKLIPDMIAAVNGAEDIGDEVANMSEEDARHLAEDALNVLHALFAALTAKPKVAA